MQTLELKVEQDHVESIAKVRNPIIAIEELIWNGLDADATKIEVKLFLNKLGGLDRIKVIDNGNGIKPDECDVAFGTLGGSAKKNMTFTPKGRVPHGKFGKGRFRAFGIGTSVTWASRFKSNGHVSKFEIKGQKSSLKKFSIGDAKEVQRKGTGVEVTVAGVTNNYASLMNSEEAAEELSKRLALYLRKYPGIEISYDGIRVDPATVEDHCEDYSITVTDKDGADAGAELTIIEWKKPTDRALYFCDDKGFALEECAPGIKAPGFHFTAYLKSDAIPELVDEGAFAFEDQLHPVVAGIVNSAKDALRQHFRAREASRADDLVALWKEEDIYPYQAVEQDPVTSIEREVFDVCAVKVHEYLPNFPKTDPKNKKLTFRLIREALESSPDSLQTILHQVLELSPEHQDHLAKILNRTHLGAVINATKTVVDRLDFISSLDSLLFGDFKETLLERKQLHRILAEELWIFGEQYILGVDDERLSSVLRKHIEILGRDDIAPEDTEVTDLDGKHRVVDLMLYRQIPQLQPNHFEHLVVELKRPKCKLGQDEISQIEKYAFSVAEDERFNTSNTKWTFVLIGNELTKFGQSKCRVQGRDFGHIHVSDDGAVNIYVKTWSTVIAEAEWRYKFFKEKLELEVTTADGLSYLRENHPNRIPDLGGVKSPD
ncbi:MAG TPA: hypothetical protein DDW52_10845 [Planctomycetaceae bacterium]|nr:hypothetical protein [Planctomycetaceae bacterium]